MFHGVLSTIIPPSYCHCEEAVRPDQNNLAVGGASSSYLTIPLQACPVLDTGTESSGEAWRYYKLQTINCKQLFYSVMLEPHIKYGINLRAASGGGGSANS
jgi:hypothetical protein